MVDFTGDEKIGKKENICLIQEYNKKRVKRTYFCKDTNLLVHVIGSNNEYLKKKRVKSRFKSLG